MSALMVQTVPQLNSFEIELPDSVRITTAAFKELCDKNRDIHAELSPDGTLIIMAPTGGTSGWKNSELTTDLALWVRSHESGMAFDSSTVFQLPNGAMRGPDAAWVEGARWDSLSEKEQDGFPPLCPDFVIELCSKSDSLTKLKNKMDEYLSNGAKLGFLIDPHESRAHIYRPKEAPVVLEKPAQLSGDPELPGLVFNLARIW